MNPISNISKKRPSPARRGLALLRVLGVAAFLGLAAIAGNALFSVHAQPSITGNDFSGRFAYANLADQVMPSVVTVYVKENLKEELAKQQKQQDELRKKLRDMPGLRDMMPFMFPGDGPSPFDDEDQGGDQDDTPAPARPDLYGLNDQFVPTSSGSGIIISDDGYILTNHHVLTMGLDEAQKVIDPVKTQLTVTLHDGTEVSGADVKVIYSNPVADLALIKISKTGLRPIKWGDSDKLRIGEAIAAVGSPLDLRETITDGIIGAKNRSIMNMNDLIQTSAVINPGSSGGPLINLDGEMVGVNRLISSNSGRWQGYGFAIPSNDAKWFVDSVLKTGHVEFGYLGVSMTPENPDRMRMLATLGLKPDADGVLIYALPDNSPALKAGMRVGDFITEVDGRKVKDNDDLLNAVKRMEPGHRITITAQRENENMKMETKKFDVTLSTRPDEKALNDSMSGGGRKKIEKVAPDKAKPMADDLSGLGLSVDPTTEDGVSGLKVTDVEAGSPAARAGIKTGDLITQLNRRPVKSVKDAEAAIKLRPDKRAHLLQFQREGSEMWVPLEPADVGATEAK